jgi:tyrosine-protein phosphatase SIW14
MRKRLVASLNLALFVATSFTQFPTVLGAYPTISQESRGEQESGPAHPGIHISKDLIPDFGEVTPTLFRGAQPGKGGFEALAKMGVRIVVDLRGHRDSERKELTKLGIRYVPMHWQCSFPKDRIFAAFITLIRKNPGKKIFVHCRVGDDRTGMMVAAYRMVEQGWSAKRAKKEMIACGFSTVHRHLICPRLADYEEEFPKRFVTKPEFAKLRSTKQDQPAQ